LEHETLDRRELNAVGPAAKALSVQKPDVFRQLLEDLLSYSHEPHSTELRKQILQQRHGVRGMADLSRHNERETTSRLQ
jgi:hypothetical protein